MTKRLLLIPVLLLSLAACGDYDGHDREGTEVVETDGDGNFVRIEVLHYNGEPLYCIKYDKGLSCDWVRYHKENG